PGRPEIRGDQPRIDDRRVAVRPRAHDDAGIADDPAGIADVAGAACDGGPVPSLDDAAGLVADEDARTAQNPAGIAGYRAGIVHAVPDSRVEIADAVGTGSRGEKPGSGADRGAAVVAGDKDR